MDILERLKIIAETTSEGWPTASIDWEYREAVKEIERLRTMLRNLVMQLESRNGCSVDAPGHSHSIPGVWDSDNGALAGKPCAWCALWREAKAMVHAHNDRN